MQIDWVLRNITCSDHFYIDQSSLLCIPECGMWSPITNTATITLDVLHIISSIIGALAGVGVLIFGCIKRNRM